VAKTRMVSSLANEAHCGGQARRDRLSRCLRPPRDSLTGRHHRSIGWGSALSRSWTSASASSWERGSVTVSFDRWPGAHFWCMGTAISIGSASVWDF